MKSAIFVCWVMLGEIDDEIFENDFISAYEKHSYVIDEKEPCIFCSYQYPMQPYANICIRNW